MKKKILMISDHPLSTSGVGVQSRWLINGLVATGRYTFRVFGAAIKHGDYNTVAVNEDFIIKPVDGFGTKEMLRHALVTERPDAVFLFTDPRFFIDTYFSSEDEIHQVCPIVYWHLWDNEPWPEFNRVLYKSCDLLNCINWGTYTMLKERFPDRTNYIPHAVPKDIFYPMSPIEQEYKRKEFFGNNADERFIGLWVARNARRKQPGDILEAWSMFCSRARELGAPDPLLVMHTDPLDQEGPNLHQIVSMFGLKNNVTFSTARVEFERMRELYNAVDFVVNTSSAEGFGIPTLEAMMCGKPIIALKTGGLTKQVVNDDGTENGIALDVECRLVAGSQLVPFIYEDHITNTTIANAFMRMYEFGPEKRREIGLKACEQARVKYNIENMVADWDRTLWETMEKYGRGELDPRWEVITL